MTIPVILLNYNSTDDCRKCISYLQFDIFICKNFTKLYKI